MEKLFLGFAVPTFTKNVKVSRPRCPSQCKNTGEIVARIVS